MTKIHVSHHAVRCYMERIGARSEAEARAVLAGPAVLAAAEFGARVVKLPRGRIILTFTPRGVAVLTVHHLRGGIPNQLLPAERGGPPPIAQERAYMQRMDRVHAA